jgi:hypothetical protein
MILHKGQDDAQKLVAAHLGETRILVLFQMQLSREADWNARSRGVYSRSSAGLHLPRVERAAPRRHCPIVY